MREEINISKREASYNEKKETRRRKKRGVKRLRSRRGYAKREDIRQTTDDHEREKNCSLVC